MTTRQTITNHFALSKTRAWGVVNQHRIIAYQAKKSGNVSIYTS